MMQPPLHFLTLHGAKIYGEVKYESWAFQNIFYKEKQKKKYAINYMVLDKK
jgi:hypothetical protein